MYNQRLARVSVVTLTVLAGIMTTIWLGGCPLAPQPQQPTSALDGSGADSTDGTDGTDGGTTTPSGPNDPRPVTPAGGDSNEPTEPVEPFDPFIPVDGGGDGGGDGGTIRPVTVELIEPLSRLQVPSGTIIDIAFTATDPDGALETLQVVLFRDNNADEDPDDLDDDGEITSADAVFERTSTSFVAGATNRLSLNTSDIFDAGLLNAESFGRFVIGVSSSDNLGREALDYSPRALILKTEIPAISLTGPVTPTSPLGIGTPVSIDFFVEDPDNALLPQPDGLKIIYAKDDDGDAQPDAGQAINTIDVVNLGVGENSYSFDTRRLLDEGLLDATGGGQFVFGVSASDNVGRTYQHWSGGTVTVESIAPGGSINSPAGATAIRPGNALEVVFTVTDPDTVLLAQPNGIKFVIARDEDGVAGADEIVFTDAAMTFAAGQHTYAVDTSMFTKQNLLDADGNGTFLVGFVIADIFGRTNAVYAPWQLTVDNVKPVGVMFKMATPDDNPPTDDGDPLLTPSVDPSDADYPLWIDPENRLMTIKGRVGFWFRTTDTSDLTIKIWADTDDDATGDTGTLVAEAVAEAGTNVDTALSIDLTDLAPDTYYYYVTIADAVTSDPYAFYAPTLDDGSDDIRLGLTKRLVGEFRLERLTVEPDDPQDSEGVVFQGVNFNDLGGSSLAGVPSLNDDNGDGVIDENDNAEFIIGARFGKAYIIENNGVGFGEAYLLYGNAGRLSGTRPLNTVGSSIDGIVFPGIRTPRAAGATVPLPSNPVLTYPANESTRWTAGLSDVTVVPDMDGDDRPELVFSFPRVESVSLSVTSPSVQHPELVPDLNAMGNLEYNAWYGLVPSWHVNESQFTRGGVVVVSSHNELLQYPDLLNRKADRVIDLHEVGQLFSSMSRPDPVIYPALVFSRGDTCADCDGDLSNGWDAGDNADPNNPTPGNCGDDNCGDPTDGREEQIARWVIEWDIAFNNQGPGGFLQSWTVPPAEPPLANPASWPYPTGLGFPLFAYPNIWAGDVAFCEDKCEITNEWFSWFPTLPGTTLAGTPSWATTGDPYHDPLPQCYEDRRQAPDVEPDPPCPPDVDETATDSDNDGINDCPAPTLADTATFTTYPDAGGAIAWTGFYGPYVYPRVSVTTGDTFPTPIGARVLGQELDDQFGTAVASDGTWLMITAPNRTANGNHYTDDVPALTGSRNLSGVAYQLRTLSPGSNGVNRSQLWLEREGAYNPDTGQFTFRFGDPENPNWTITRWPQVDVEDFTRTDYTMPVPHNYIIEAIGSKRGSVDMYNRAMGATCPPEYNAGETGADAAGITAFTPYPVGTAGYYMDRTPQIVGPHENAKLSFVRALGDVNDDGVNDFAVGSPNIRKTVPGTPVTFSADPADTVGSIFIVYGRPTGVEGDYLLEQLALDINDNSRLNGVLLQGSKVGETLARVFDDAGDFNGDEIADVVIGNKQANNGTGEAIVLFGAIDLVSPAGGWTPDNIPAGRAIRFVGEAVGDLAGANVTGVGNIDADTKKRSTVDPVSGETIIEDTGIGFDDILIAAPNADVDLDGDGTISSDEQSVGKVYLIYGSDELSGTINLADVGTVDVPGAVFIGRSGGDQLGGGQKLIGGTNPNFDDPAVPDSYNVQAFSRGVAQLGDIDGDGADDLAISAMLGDVLGRQDAGEVYVIYGRKGEGAPD